MQPGVFNATNAISRIMVLIDILLMMPRGLRLSLKLMVMNKAEAGKQTVGSHRPPYEEQENDYHGFKPSHEEEINLNSLAFNLYFGSSWRSEDRQVSLNSISTRIHF